MFKLKSQKNKRKKFRDRKFPDLQRNPKLDKFFKKIPIYIYYRKLKQSAVF